jgi:hypothetical protein
MIVSGGSRSNWRFFSKHLMKSEENERVQIVEMRGLAADDIREAFREMDALASGTRCKNFFYHANINPRANEMLTPEQWEQAIDTLEAELGLTDHSRFVVEHEKDGRTHRHVVWSRIDPEKMTAVSDSNNYAAHERAARQLEQAFGHEAVLGAHDREPDRERPDRRPDNWETFRGHESGIDPQILKAELTELWHQADSGKAFVAALEERGYILAKGDRRDFCVIDQAGDAHSLARRIDGAKAKDIRERLADIEREALPNVEQASAIARSRAEAAPPPVVALEQDADASATHERQEPLPEPPAEKMTIEEQRDPAIESKAGESTAQRAEPAADAFDQFANDVKQSMQENSGSPRFVDGLNFWERAVAVFAIATLVADAFTWVKGRWQDFVGHMRGSGTPERDDPGIER